MKIKPLLLLALAICTLVACSSKKKYYRTIYGKYSSINRDTIFASSDSAAYREGALLFSSSIDVYVKFTLANYRYIPEPTRFEVTNEDGEDIEKKLSADCIIHILHEVNEIKFDLKVPPLEKEK